MEGILVLSRGCLPQTTSMLLCRWEAVLQAVDASPRVMSCCRFLRAMVLWSLIRSLCAPEILIGCCRCPKGGTSDVLVRPGDSYSVVSEDTLCSVLSDI